MSKRKSKNSEPKSLQEVFPHYNVEENNENGFTFLGYSENDFKNKFRIKYSSNPELLKIVEHKNFFDLCNDLYCVVEKLKGFEYVYGTNSWNDPEIENIFKKEEIEITAKEFFIKFLLKELLYLKNSNELQYDAFDEKYYIEPNWVECPDEINETYHKKELFTKYDCVIIMKNFFEKWKFDKNLYSLENIKKKYGNYRISVIEQNATCVSFQTDSEDLYQKKINFTVSDYIDYQRQMKDYDINSKEISNKRIKFGVNIDIGDWKEMMNDLEKKLPDWIKFKSPEDCLSFARQEIEGITLPQLYLKVAGSWTGGHEENLRIMAVNINTGQGDVEWHCVPPEDVVKFRKKVMEKEGIDIHKMEGLWYSYYSFCLKHDIRVMKWIQKPGDIVILRPGTLHWVRSLSVTTNVAWNLCHFKFEDFQKMDLRFQINKRIKFKTIIANKTLFLDILNNAYDKLDFNTLSFISMRLKGFVKYALEKKKVFDKFIIENKFQIEYINDNIKKSNVIFCSNCYGELFMFWGLCENCLPDGFFCSGCMKSHIQNCESQKQHLFFEKYQQKHLDLFFEKVDKLVEYHKPAKIKYNPSEEQNMKAINDLNANQTEKDFKDFILEINKKKNGKIKSLVNEIAAHKFYVKNDHKPKRPKNIQAKSEENSSQSKKNNLKTSQENEKLNLKKIKNSNDADDADDAENDIKIKTLNKSLNDAFNFEIEDEQVGLGKRTNGIIFKNKSEKRQKNIQIGSKKKMYNFYCQKFHLINKNIHKPRNVKRTKTENSDDDDDFSIPRKIVKKENIETAQGELDFINKDFSELANEKQNNIDILREETLTDKPNKFDESMEMEKKNSTLHSPEKLKKTTKEVFSNEKNIFSSIPEKVEFKKPKENSTENSNGQKDDQQETNNSNKEEKINNPNNNQEKNWGQNEDNNNTDATWGNKEENSNNNVNNENKGNSWGNNENMDPEENKRNNLWNAENNESGNFGGEKKDQNKSFNQSFSSKNNQNQSFEDKRTKFRGRRRNPWREKKDGYKNDNNDFRQNRRRNFNREENNQRWNQNGNNQSGYNRKNNYNRNDNRGSNNWNSNNDQQKKNWNTNDNNKSSWNTDNKQENQNNEAAWNSTSNKENENKEENLGAWDSSNPKNENETNNNDKGDWNTGSQDKEANDGGWNENAEKTQNKEDGEWNTKTDNKNKEDKNDQGDWNTKQDTNNEAGNGWNTESNQNEGGGWNSNNNDNTNDNSNNDKSKGGWNFNKENEQGTNSWGKSNDNQSNGFGNSNGGGNGFGGRNFNDDNGFQDRERRGGYRGRGRGRGRGRRGGFDDNEGGFNRRGGFRRNNYGDNNNDGNRRGGGYRRNNFRDNQNNNYEDNENGGFRRNNYRNNNNNNDEDGGFRRNNYRNNNNNDDDNGGFRRNNYRNNNNNDDENGGFRRNNYRNNNDENGGFRRNNYRNNNNDDENGGNGYRGRRGGFRGRDNNNFNRNFRDNNGFNNDRRNDNGEGGYRKRRYDNNRENDGDNFRGSNNNWENNKGGSSWNKNSRFGNSNNNQNKETNNFEGGWNKNSENSKGQEEKTNWNTNTNDENGGGWNSNKNDNTNKEEKQNEADWNAKNDDKENNDGGWNSNNNENKNGNDNDWNQTETDKKNEEKGNEWGSGNKNREENNPKSNLNEQNKNTNEADWNSNGDNKEENDGGGWNTENNDAAADANGWNNNGNQESNANNDWKNNNNNTENNDNNSGKNWKTQRNNYHNHNERKSSDNNFRNNRYGRDNQHSNNNFNNNENNFHNNQRGNFRNRDHHNKQFDNNQHFSVNKNYPENEWNDERENPKNKFKKRDQVPNFNFNQPKEIIQMEDLEKDSLKELRTNLFFWKKEKKGKEEDEFGMILNNYNSKKNGQDNKQGVSRIIEKFMNNSDTNKFFKNKSQIDVKEKMKVLEKQKTESNINLDLDKFQKKKLDLLTHSLKKREKGVNKNLKKIYKEIENKEKKILLHKFIKKYKSEIANEEMNQQIFQKCLKNNYLSICIQQIKEEKFKHQIFYLIKIIVLQHRQISNEEKEILENYLESKRLWKKVIDVFYII